MTIHPTRNTDWGFFGTISRIQNAHTFDPTNAWEVASRRIAGATTASPEGVRDFLDSRHGRHFADDVSMVLSKGKTMADAIEVTIARWMGWRIDPPPAARSGSRGDFLTSPASPATSTSWPRSPTDAGAFRFRRAAIGVCGSGS